MDKFKKKPRTEPKPQLGAFGPGNKHEWNKIVLLNTKHWIKISQYFFPTDSSFWLFWGKLFCHKYVSVHIRSNYRIRILGFILWVESANQITRNSISSVWHLIKYNIWYDICFVMLYLTIIPRSWVVHVHELIANEVRSILWCSRTLVKQTENLFSPRFFATLSQSCLPNKRGFKLLVISLSCFPCGSITYWTSPTCIKSATGLKGGKTM